MKIKKTTYSNNNQILEIHLTRIILTQEEIIKVKLKLVLKRNYN